MSERRSIASTLSATSGSKYSRLTTAPRDSTVSLTTTESIGLEVGAICPDVTEDSRMNRIPEDPTSERTEDQADVPERRMQKLFLKMRVEPEWRADSRTR